MFTIQKKAFIQASAQEVYQAVSQLDTYQLWNPWVIHCTNGNAKVGEFSQVQVKLGHKLMSVKHKIIERSPYRRFVWCDTGWFTWFAFGQRARDIETCDNGVNYTVELTITGPLAFIAKWLYCSQLNEGLDAETAGLKVFCERA